MSTQKAKFELFSRLQALGFTYEEAVKLRRIELTLSRWFELECGTGDGTVTRSIERDGNGEGTPFMRVQYHGRTFSESRYPIADRESGARKRLADIMSKHRKLVSYVQTDPRGCALYILRKADVNGSNIDQVYTRGLAVCC